MVSEIIQELRSLENGPKVYPNLHEICGKLGVMYDFFLHKFMMEHRRESLLDTPEIYDIVMNRETITSTFELMRFLLVPEAGQAFMDLFFALIKTESDENMLWELYASFASPWNCLTLPFSYLRANPQKLERFMTSTKVIFMLDDEQISPAWYGLFGSLLFLRIMTAEQALELAERMQPLLLVSQSSFASDEYASYLSRFIELVFGNQELIDGEDDGFYSIPASKGILPDHEARRNFFVSLWNLTSANIADIPKSTSSDLVRVILNLERSFPYITAELSIKFMSDTTRSFDDIIITNLSDYNGSLANEDELEAAIAIYDEYIIPNMEKSSLTGLRTKMAAITKFVDKTMSASIGNSEIDTSVLAERIVTASDNLRLNTMFVPPVTDEITALAYVKFAFSLSDINASQSVLKLIITRIAGNEQMISFLLEQIVHETRKNPEMFVMDGSFRLPIKHCSQEVTQFVRDMIETQTSRRLLSAKLLDFIGENYKSSFISHEQILEFLDYLKSFPPSATFDLDHFSEFLGIVTDMASLLINLEEKTLPVFDDELLRSNADDIFASVLEYFATYSEFSANYMTTPGCPFIILLNYRILNARNLSFKTAQFDILLDAKLPEFNGDIRVASAYVIEKYLRFFKYGATKNDLEKLLMILKGINTTFEGTHVEESETIVTFESAIYLTLIMVLRSAPELLPINMVLTLYTEFVNLMNMRVSVGYLVYNSLPVEGRISTFLVFAKTSYVMSNLFKTFDPTTFDGFSPARREELQISVLDSMSSNGHATFEATEVFCFWMRHGQLSDQMIQKLLKLLAKHPYHYTFSTFSAIRIIFSDPTLKKHRKQALKLLDQFAENISHATAYSEFVSFCMDYHDDADFKVWLDKSPYAEEVKNNIAYFQKQKSLTTPGIFSILSGIENVCEFYRLAMNELFLFNASLTRKFVLFRVAMANLTLLQESFSPSSMIFDEYTSASVDRLVQISVRLLCLLVTDNTSYHHALLITPDNFNMISKAITLYVRDYDIQSELYYFIFGSIRDERIRDYIIKVFPDVFSIRRMPMNTICFKSLLHFFADDSVFVPMIERIISNSFTKPVSNNEALDLKSSDLDEGFVSERFFYLMADLHANFLLPDRLTEQVLSLMNQYPERVNLDDKGMYQFLLSMVTPRTSNPRSDVLYPLIRKCLGPEVDKIKSINPVAVNLILDFFEIRNDVIGLGITRGTLGGSRELGTRLQKLASKRINSSVALTSIISIMSLTETGRKQYRFFDDLSIWNEVSKVHFANLIVKYNGDAVLSFKVFDLLPEILDIQQATACHFNNSWFKMITKIPLLFAKVEQSTLAGLLNANMIRKTIYILQWLWEGSESNWSVLFALVRALRSSKVDLQITFIESLVDSPLYLVIKMQSKGLLRLFHEIRFFKKTIPRKTIESLIENVEVDNSIAVETNQKETFEAIEQLKQCQASNLKEVVVLLTERAVDCVKSNDRAGIFSVLEALLDKLTELESLLTPSTELAHAVCGLLQVSALELTLTFDPSKLSTFVRILAKLATERTALIMSTIYLLSTQLTTHQSQVDFLNALSASVKPNFCPIPEELPEYIFGAKPELMVNFIELYMLKLAESMIIIRSSQYEFDYAHIQLLLKLLVETPSATERTIITWTRLLSLVDNSEIATDYFITLMRKLLTENKGLVKVVAPYLIVDQAVEEKLVQLTAVFKIIFQTDSEAYKAAYDRLTGSNRALLDQVVGIEVLERKRKTVHDLACKCMDAKNWALMSRMDLKILTDDQKFELLRKIWDIEIDESTLLQVMGKLSDTIPINVLKSAFEKKLFDFENINQQYYYALISGHIQTDEKQLAFYIKKANGLTALQTSSLINEFMSRGLLNELVNQNVSCNDAVFLYFLQNPKSSLLNIAKDFNLISETQHHILSVI